MAITEVVVMPNRGKRKGTWMGCALLGHIVSGDATEGVVGSGVVDIVYM